MFLRLFPAVKKESQDKQTHEHGSFGLERALGTVRDALTVPLGTVRIAPIFHRG